MYNKVLQNKLAKWIGLTQNPYTLKWFSDPNTCIGDVDLVNSLDAQREYVFPKIYNLPEAVYGDVNIQMEWVAEYKKWNVFIDLVDTYDASDENLAVAFALACKKLIDSLEKSNVK
jgi:hypothetical protein